MTTGEAREVGGDVSSVLNSTRTLERLDEADEESEEEYAFRFERPDTCS